MALFLKVLQGIIAALPGLVQLAEHLHSGQSGKGAAKSALVIDAVTAGAAAAGVVDPTHLQLIKGISQATINGIVAVQNATGQFTTSPPAAPAPVGP